VWRAGGQTPAMASVNHVGLTVGDLDASLAFYTEVVGMTVVVPRYRSGGAWFDTLTGNHGAAIDVAMLQSGSLVLQLVQYHQGGDPVAFTGHARVGNVHLSIDVDDVEKKRAAIARTHDPTPIVGLPFPGARSFYVHDPDGVPVEFLQLPDDAHLPR